MAEAAEKYVFLNNPGAYIGPWLNRTTPYMVDPMNVLASRQHNACVFAGPAQCAKTQALVLNWMAYNIAVDPMDFTLYCPSQAAARDFSTRRVDRLHRYSEDLKTKLLPGSDNDNKFDKHYRSGIMLTLSWPSVTELAGKPVGRVALTDFDRMPDDVEGDGNPFDLASKRTTTFGSMAMTLAESSPSRPVTDTNWIARSAHEAPPTTGILALYNRGDRRRWYWPCPHCATYFEGKFEQFEWDRKGGNVDASETVRLIPPCCGKAILPDQRADMQEWGVWLRDGEHVDKSGRIVGKGVRSNIASFWLNGVAATFVSWQRLVQIYLDALDEYERTGSEESLKKFFNNDLGQPYIPKSQEAQRAPEVLKKRAEALPEREVPPEVRTLIATVDVQKNLFVVQVHGIIPGEPYDIVLVDRFQIRKSLREDADGDREWVKPGTYLEDWDLLIEHVIEREYPIADGSGRRMRVFLTGCDSNGPDSTTTNAYNFYRRLKAAGLSSRFQLLRGEHKPGAPRAAIDFPDSKRKDRLAPARGDVPVLFLNSNMLKDDLSGRLDNVLPGKGMIRTPDWMEEWFYKELCAEVRTEKGWVNAAGRRNEAWDLLYYVIGLCAWSQLGIERPAFWKSPPSWATRHDDNPFVVGKSTKRGLTSPEADPYDFARFGRSLA